MGTLNNRRKKKKTFLTNVFRSDFSHGKFGLLSPGKANCNRVALPNLRYMLGVLVIP